MAHGLKDLVPVTVSLPVPLLAQIDRELPGEDWNRSQFVRAACTRFLAVRRRRKRRHQQLPGPTVHLQEAA